MIRYREAVLEHRFLLLFCTLVLALVASTMLGSDRSARFVVTALFLLVFGACVSAAARHRVVLAVVALAALAAAIASGAEVSIVGPETGLAVAVTGAALFGCMVVVMARDVFAARRVTPDVLFGAAAIYLMLALFWASAYEIIEIVAPGSFHLTADPLDVFARDWEFRYFSIVTVSTLGYGDIRPLTPFARTLAALEAIFGQLYVAIVVARLVAMQTTSPSAPPET